MGNNDISEKTNIKKPNEVKDVQSRRDVVSSGDRASVDPVTVNQPRRTLGERVNQGLDSASQKMNAAGERLDQRTERYNRRTEKINAFSGKVEERTSVFQPKKKEIDKKKNGNKGSKIKDGAKQAVRGKYRQTKNSAFQDAETGENAGVGRTLDRAKDISGKIVDKTGIPDKAKKFGKRELKNGKEALSKIRGVAGKQIRKRTKKAVKKTAKKTEKTAKRTVKSVKNVSKATVRMINAIIKMISAAFKSVMVLGGPIVAAILIVFVLITTLVLLLPAAGRKMEERSVGAVAEYIEPREVKIYNAVLEKLQPLSYIDDAAKPYVAQGVVCALLYQWDHYDLLDNTLTPTVRESYAWGSHDDTSSREYTNQVNNGTVTKEQFAYEDEEGYGILMWRGVEKANLWEKVKLYSGCDPTENEIDISTLNANWTDDTVADIRAIYRTLKKEFGSAETALGMMVCMNQELGDWNYKKWLASMGGKWTDILNYYEEVNNLVRSGNTEAAKAKALDKNAPSYGLWGLTYRGSGAETTDLMAAMYNFAIDWYQKNATLRNFDILNLRMQAEAFVCFCHRYSETGENHYYNDGRYSGAGHYALSSLGASSGGTKKDKILRAAAVFIEQYTRPTSYLSGAATSAQLASTDYVKEGRGDALVAVVENSFDISDFDMQLRYMLEEEDFQNFLNYGIGTVTDWDAINVCVGKLDNGETDIMNIDTDSIMLETITSWYSTHYHTSSPDENGVYRTWMIDSETGQKRTFECINKIWPKGDTNAPDSALRIYGPTAAAICSSKGKIGTLLDWAKRFCDEQRILYSLDQNGTYLSKLEKWDGTTPLEETHYICCASFATLCMYKAGMITYTGSGCDTPRNWMNQNYSLSFDSSGDEVASRESNNGFMYAGGACKASGTLNMTMDEFDACISGGLQPGDIILYRHNNGCENTKHSHVSIFSCIKDGTYYEYEAGGNSRDGHGFDTYNSPNTDWQVSESRMYVSGERTVEVWRYTGQ